MKKRLIAIAISCLAPPVSAQPSSEWLAQAPLPDFVVGFRDAQNGGAIVERIPRRETVEIWTRMVTVQRFANIGPRIRYWTDTFGPSLSQACPGAVVSRPVYSRAEGHQQVEFRVDCPRNPQTRQPETFLMRAIAGASDLYSAQIAFRHVPSAQETEWARRQLASVTLCTRENASPVCRAPAE